MGMRKTLELPDLTQQQVVEPASAILGIVNERAIPINADHRSMVRFSPNEPEKYRLLKNALKGLLNEIEAGTSNFTLLLYLR